MDGHKLHPLTGIPSQQVADELVARIRAASFQVRIGVDALGGGLECCGCCMGRAVVLERVERAVHSQLHDQLHEPLCGRCFFY